MRVKNRLCNLGSAMGRFLIPFGYGQLTLTLPCGQVGFRDQSPANLAPERRGARAGYGALEGLDGGEAPDPMASAAEAQPRRPNRQCQLQFPRCGLASADYPAPRLLACSPPFPQDPLQTQPGGPAAILFASHDFAFSSLRRSSFQASSLCGSSSKITSHDTFTMPT
jgi:hypothetical protein